MRPRGSVGEIRVAIREAVRTHGPMALRDVMQHACVGTDAARMTVKNMLRSGELERVGFQCLAQSRRAIALYDLAEPVERASDDVHDGGLMVLSSAISSWR